jgi:arsenite-transporting ATPase
VVNRSLAAAGVHDPVLAARAAAEAPLIAEVRARLATRTALVPWVAPEPVGAAGLRALVDAGAAVAHG